MIVYRGEPPESHRHAITTNGFYSFWVVDQGSASVQWDDGGIKLSAGDWILTPPFLAKRQDFSEGTRILSLGFEALWSNGIPWMNFDRPVTGKVSRENSLIMTAQHIVAGFRGRDALHLPLSKVVVSAIQIAELQSNLYHLLALLAPILLRQGASISSSHAQDSRVDRIVAELQSNPSIRALPYSRWKKEAGLSRVQIDRLFRAEFGNTPRHQRDLFLLAAIKRQLLTGRMSIKETAAHFGFSDSSHLCRWFRHHASVSPEHFRLHGAG